jgi:Glutathione S-transferase, N-terminal domain
MANPSFLTHHDRKGAQSHQGPRIARFASQDEIALFDYTCLQTGLIQMFALYYTPHTCSLASHIALEDAGAEYELRRIDFSNNEQQSPDYLRVNPKARVPALVSPHGILTETPAILTFIAQTFPQAALAPLNDPFAFAELHAFISYLCSTLHVAHAHRMRGYRWASDASSRSPTHIFSRSLNGWRTTALTQGKFRGLSSTARAWGIEPA